MSWLWPFGSAKPAEPAPNTVIEIAPPPTHQLQPSNSPAAKIAANAAAARLKAPPVQGATAPTMTSPPLVESSTRKEYVSLVGGSRKGRKGKGKSKKSKKSKKSRKGKSKASKSRK